MHLFFTAAVMALLAGTPAPEPPSSGDSTIEGLPEEGLPEAATQDATDSADEKIESGKDTESTDANETGGAHDTSESTELLREKDETVDTDTVRRAVDNAVAAFERGKMARALELAREGYKLSPPSSKEAKAVRLIITFALLRLHRVGEATAYLEEMALHGPDIGAYGLYLLAGAKSAHGECGEAVELVGGIPQTSVFKASSLSRLSRCWLRRGELQSALAAAEQMEASAQSDGRLAEAAYLRGRVHEAQRKRVEARELYRDILVSYPLTAAGRKAKDQLSNLGLAVKPLGPEELLPHAESQRGNVHRFRARRLYASVIRKSRGKAHADLRYAAELGLAELDIVDRRYGRALARINRAHANSNNAEIRARALFLQGDILSRRGRVTEALQAYDKILSEHPETAFAPEGALAAAQLAYGARRFDTAHHFARWMAEKDADVESVAVISNDGAFMDGTASQETRAHALWILAWLERRSGSPAETVDTLLAQIEPQSELSAASLYWRAKLAIERNQVEDAEVFAELLARESPTSFYALAAADLLREHDPTCKVRVALPTIEEEDEPEAMRPSLQPEDLTGALTLFDYGLHSEAQRVVRLAPSSELSYTDRAIAAWIYRRCGDIHRAAVLTRRIVANPRVAEDPAVLELSYPRPFAEVVDEVTAQYGIPPELIYAVMRQESLFNPKALSPRKARGLMQMIRPTAIRMARDAQLRRFRLNNLFQPETSIHLGAHYLASLLELFDGHLPAAVAAYHAGENAVARWLKTRDNLSPDEFIEEIPFSTTRGYVKKVLSSYGVYRVLYRPEVERALDLSRPHLPAGDERASLH